MLGHFGLEVSGNPPTVNGIASDINTHCYKLFLITTE